MARGPEAKLQDKSRDHAKKNGWYARKLQAVGVSGFPDFLFSKNGDKFLVEFKREGETPTPLQLREHRLLREAGWEVFVIDNFEDFKTLLSSREER